MDSQVDEVKSKVDIVGLIGEYVQLKKAGRNFKAVCPFHSEKTPSFMVNPDRQIFKCFGCSEGGDAFTFLQKMEGMEFGESLKILAARAGVRLKQYTPSPAEKKKDTLIEINNIANNLFRYILEKHALGKNAVSYLKQRSVSKKSITDFQLGFAPRQRNFTFKFLIKKGYSPQDIVSSGLVLSTSDGPVDRFRGRLTFPIADMQGRVIAFSARTLGSGEPKYLNSSETALFSKSKALYGINLAKVAIKKEKKAVLVEGNLDVISSHQVGVENTVAPLGTALTIQQVEGIKKLTDNLVFAFDTDLAGDAAAKRGIELAESIGMNMKVAMLKTGKDPDEVIKKNPKEWEKLVNEAVPIYDYFISSAVKKYGSDTAEGKRRIAGEILPILKQMTNEINRAQYLQTLSYRIGTEEDILRQALKKLSSSENSFETTKEILEKPLTPKVSNIVEKYLLAMIIQSGTITNQIRESLFTQEPYQEIFKLIKKYKKKEDKWKVKIFLKFIPKTLLPTFDELLLLEVGEDILNDQQKLEGEMTYCANRLKQLGLRKKLKKLSLEIKQAEAVGNNDKIRMLSEEFRDVSATLTSLATK